MLMYDEYSPDTGLSHSESRLHIVGLCGPAALL